MYTPTCPLGNAEISIYVIIFELYPSADINFIVWNTEPVDYTGLLNFISNYDQPNGMVYCLLILEQ